MGDSPAAGAGSTLPVLLNPRSGGGRLRDPGDLERRLARAGVSARVEAVAPQDLRQRIDGLAGRSRIGVAGGDGSMRTAAGALLGSETALAPIPTGRLNHFARRAGIGTIEEAAAAILADRRRSVFVGRVAGAVFLDTAVVGGHADFVRIRERLRPVLTTWPAALAAGLATFLRWPRVRLSLRAPGLELELRTAMVWVGVGRRSFPEPHQAPLASSDEALQVVVLSGGRTAAARLAGTLLSTLLHGGARAQPGTEGGNMQLFHAPWIELVSPSHLPIVLDGEPRLLASPLRIELDATPLRLVAAADT